jgi:hypothetical protein
MGRRLTDDDIKQMNIDGWAKTLIGKMVVADLEWYTTAEGAERLRIIRVKPYRKAEPPPQPVGAAPSPTPAAPRSNRGRTLADADDGSDNAVPL